MLEKWMMLKQKEREIKEERIALEESIFMKNPNKIELILSENKGSEILKYHLPSIYYGISKNTNEKECYIYSILNKKEKKLSEDEERFIKQVSRKLYKINKDVVK